MNNRSQRAQNAHLDGSINQNEEMIVRRSEANSDANDRVR